MMPHDLIDWCPMIHRILFIFFYDAPWIRINYWFWLIDARWLQRDENSQKLIFYASHRPPGFSSGKFIFHDEFRWKNKKKCSATRVIGHSSQTQRIGWDTVCRSQELQVHVIDLTRWALFRRDSSPTWYPRCVAHTCISISFAWVRKCCLHGQTSPNEHSALIAIIDIRVIMVS